MFDGSVELDESYLGGVRKGKKDRGAADKVVVFGVLKRNDKVYTVVVEDARAATLMPIIVKKIKLGSIVYTDSWKAIMLLTSINFDIRESIIRHVLPKGKTISMDRKFLEPGETNFKTAQWNREEIFPTFFEGMRVWIQLRHAKEKAKNTVGLVWILKHLSFFIIHIHMT